MHVEVKRLIGIKENKAETAIVYWDYLFFFWFSSTEVTDHGYMPASVPPDNRVSCRRCESSAKGVVVRTMVPFGWLKSSC